MPSAGPTKLEVPTPEHQSHFLNTATTEIYTLSRHYALPTGVPRHAARWRSGRSSRAAGSPRSARRCPRLDRPNWKYRPLNTSHISLTRQPPRSTPFPDTTLFRPGCQGTLLGGDPVGPAERQVALGRLEDALGWTD